jgi:hypothetical protein
LIELRVLVHGLPWAAAEHDKEQNMRARIATLRTNDKEEEEERSIVLRPSCSHRLSDLSSSKCVFYSVRFVE